MEPGIGVPPPRESALARVCTRVHFQAPGSNSANRVQRSSTAGVDRGFVSFRGIRSLGRGPCRGGAAAELCLRPRRVKTSPWTGPRIKTQGLCAPPGGCHIRTPCGCSDPRVEHGVVREVATPRLCGPGRPGAATPPHPASLEELGHSGDRLLQVLTKLSPLPLSGHST